MSTKQQIRKTPETGDVASRQGRARRTALAAAIIGGLVLGPLVAVGSPVNAAQGAPAHATTQGGLPSVDPLYEDDPRIGDPLLVLAFTNVPNAVITVRIAGTVIESKPVDPDYARFDIPTTGMKVGTPVRIDFEANNGTVRAESAIVINPQPVTGSVRVASMTVSYSAPVYFEVVPDKPSSVPTTGKADLMLQGRLASNTQVRTDRTGALPTVSHGPGAYPYAIHYRGDDAWSPTAAGAGSAEGTLTIVKMPTETRAQLSKTVLSQGQSLKVAASVRSTDPLTTLDPGASRLKVTAIPEGGGDRITLAEADYPGNGEEKTVDLSEFAKQQLGTWVIRTEYVEGVTARSSSSESTVRIAPPGEVLTPTATSLELDRSTATLGGAAVNATAKVLTESGAAAAGQVVFKVDGSQIAVAALDAQGVARARVPAAKLGARSVTAHYLGSAEQAGSESAARSFTVLPAVKPVDPKPAKVKSSVKASFKKLSKHRVKAKVYVRAVKPATGRIEIRYGSKVVAKGTLKPGAKSITLTTKKLKKGKRKLTIRYLGSSTVSASSKSYKVKVR